MTLEPNPISNHCSKSSGRSECDSFIQGIIVTLHTDPFPRNHGHGSSIFVFKVTHVEGDVNPVRDMEIIHEELRLKDLEYLNKRLAELEKVFVRGGEKKVPIFTSSWHTTMSKYSLLCHLQ